MLLIFWIIHLDWAAERGSTLTVKQVGAFALVCFFGVALGQMLLVLTLTPALVAGVIADEKQRKTLHYLLASRLSGPEIVIGKLLGGMLHVGVLLAVSVPVLSMLVLLGGIDPMVILLACGAAAALPGFWRPSRSGCPRSRGECAKPCSSRMDSSSSGSSSLSSSGGLPRWAGRSPTGSWTK